MPSTDYWQRQDKNDHWEYQWGVRDEPTFITIYTLIQNFWNDPLSGPCASCCLTKQNLVQSVLFYEAELGIKPVCFVSFHEAKIGMKCMRFVLFMMLKSVWNQCFVQFDESLTFCWCTLKNWLSRRSFLFISHAQYQCTLSNEQHTS